MKNGINKRGLLALAFGHMAVDMQTSSLAVIIPLLYVTYKLDYAAAALIVTLNSLTSSFIQPIFGLVSDRKPLRWLLPLGTSLTALGMLLVLFVPSYWLVLLVVIVSGLGSAAFHPEGSRNANYVSGEKKASGMSVFFVGGNLGFALGPILFTVLLGLFGTAGAFGMLVPGFIATVLLWRLMPLYARAATERGQKVKVRTTTTAPVSKGRTIRTLSIILSVISLRSMLQTGLITFIPLYFISLPGEKNKEYAAFLLAVFLFAGAIGTLSGGFLADRLGRKTVMAGSLSVVTPLLLLFLNSSGAVQVITIALAGAALIAASSLTVVMAQEAMPNSIGLASGLTLGLGFGAGGLGAAALGKYADLFGLPQTMMVLAFLPLAVVGFTLLMPGGKKPASVVATPEAAPMQTEQPVSV